MNTWENTYSPVEQALDFRSNEIREFECELSVILDLTNVADYVEVYAYIVDTSGDDTGASSSDFSGFRVILW